MRQIGLDSILIKFEKNLKGRIILLGVGNTLRGDDGFGAILAERLKGRVNFKVFNASSAPENFLGAVVKENPDTVLIADAVDFKGRAGEARLLNAGEIKTENIFFTHNVSMDLIFKFLNENSRAEAYLLSVQPKNIEFSNKMSDEVGRALDELENWFLKKYPDGTNDN